MYLEMIDEGRRGGLFGEEKTRVQSKVFTGNRESGMKQ